MRVGLLTREYPPDVYGGAGVHVEFLARELRELVDLDVHCWGEGRAEGVLPVVGYLSGAKCTWRRAEFLDDVVHELNADSGAFRLRSCTLRGTGADRIRKQRYNG